MPIPDPPTFDPTARAAFRHWARVPLRYVDQDPLGHINNAALPMCLEQARVELIQPVLKAHAGPDADIVLARVTIDYLKEMSYPGTIEIGTRLTRLGTKSVATAHAAFMAGSEVCVGTAVCVLVLFDTRKRASIAPGPALRSALEGLMA